VELKAELIDRYDEWYNKVKMVVAKCELNCLKKKARKEQEEKARKEQDEKARRKELEKAREERRLPSTAGGHQRLKQATWPRTHGESELRKPLEPLERHRSSLNPIPEGGKTIDIKEAEPSNAAPAKVSQPVGESRSPDKMSSQAPHKGAATEMESFLSNESGSLLENQESGSSLNGESARQESSNSSDGAEAEAHPPPTKEERQAERELGKKLFEARKRSQKEKVAKEVLENLSYYRLVGESYVHGMMNGEAIKRQNEEDLPRFVFELR
jgi:hypothetical protein